VKAHRDIACVYIDIYEFIIILMEIIYHLFIFFFSNSKLRRLPRLNFLFENSYATHPNSIVMPRITALLPQH
jgi:hypothetical protein